MATALQPAAIPTASSEIAMQLSAVLKDAGIASLDSTGWICVTGADRLRWLNGMVTNSIQELAPGQGCYNFVLNAQGRILGDLTVFLLEDSILLQTSRDQIEKLLAHLNHFIIMDDVELTDLTAQRSGLLIAGPRATELLGKLDLPASPHKPLRLQSATWKSELLEVLHAHSPLVPRYELWSGPQTIVTITADLLAARATVVSSVVLEQLRILEGTPRYGTDIRNSEGAHDLPQETSPIGVQSRALHFTKGCYLGQEIVERIHSRGNVHRAFTGFVLSGLLPAPGTILQAESKPIGELTSVSFLYLPEPESASESVFTTAHVTPGPVQLALGYVRREVLERKLSLEYPGGIATPIALPCAIP